jgi:hypothetical protein
MLQDELLNETVNIQVAHYQRSLLNEEVQIE